MKVDKNIIAIIPARGGSKGIPRKNIIGFCGKPLIAWTIENAKESKLISNVYVSTDSEEIASISREYGAKIIQRPWKISGDEASSEEALKHALGEIGGKIDYVVFLQATSPFRDSEDIDNAIKKIIIGEADSLFSGSDAGDLCLWKEKDAQFQSVNYDYENRKMRQDIGKQFLENGSIYVFKPEVLFKYNNRLGGKITVLEMEPIKSFEIDDLDDLKFCKEVFKIWKKK